MSNLATFILAEGLKTRSVLALHRFDTLFKSHVSKELQQQLFYAWKATAKSLKLKVDQRTAEDVKFKNPKALTEIVVTALPVKLYSSTEHGQVKQVSPSVKLPLLLSEADRAIAQDAFLEAAAEQLKKVISTFSEVFIHELKSGQATTDFKVSRSRHAVRLCLSALEKGVEHETVLYHIAIEHGKINSKVRDHDTIYLSIDR